MVKEVEEGKQSRTDLNLVNCQREGLPTKSLAKIEAQVIY